MFAGVSVVAFLRDGHTGHPPRTPTAPAAGDVRIRVVGTDFCLGERRGTRSGQVYQVPCAAAGVPLYALAEAGDGRWRIASDHPDYGAGCSGLPSGGRVPDAPYEDSECGDPTRIEEFSLEPHGHPRTGLPDRPGRLRAPRRLRHRRRRPRRRLVPPRPGPLRTGRRGPALRLRPPGLGPVRRIMAGAATPGTAPRRVAETPR
ncbi:hypothetical protein [Streptomyces cinereoruber]|uniref:hypothetical protein n=1 Tax=Streptomyces cinereoruber TaxID=67260 RepID=UPI00363C16A7